MFSYNFTIEHSAEYVLIQLPIGFKKIMIKANIRGLNVYNSIIASNRIVLGYFGADSSATITSFEFDILKTGSPCTFVTRNDSDSNINLYVHCLLGGTPDPYYFDRDENGIILPGALEARQAARIVYPNKLTAEEVADLMNGSELTTADPTTTPEPEVTEVTQAATATVKTKTK